MSGRSVNLIPHFSWPPKRLTSIFTSNRQLPLLNQRKEKRKYVARPGIEPRTSDLRVRCPTDCATRPSPGRLNKVTFQAVQWLNHSMYRYLKLFLTIYNTYKDPIWKVLQRNWHPTPFLGPENFFINGITVIILKVERFGRTDVDCNTVSKGR